MSAYKYEGEPPAIALVLAYCDLYEMITDTRHRLGEHRSRKTIAAHLEEIRARADLMYEAGSLLETALKETDKINREVREAYDKLSGEATDAYRAGWEDALKQLVQDLPGDSGAIIEWLVKTMMSGAVYRSEHFERAMGLIREARRYLENGGE